MEAAAWQAPPHAPPCRARGNITIDMEWKDGKVTNYTLTTTTPNPAPVKVIVNGQETTVTPTVK